MCNRLVQGVLINLGDWGACVSDVGMREFELHHAALSCMYRRLLLAIKLVSLPRLARLYGEAPRRVLARMASLSAFVSSHPSWMIGSADCLSV